MFDAPPALPKAPRKALGTVNRASEKAVKTNGPLKQKQTTFPAKKVSIVYKDTKFKHFSTGLLKWLGILSGFLPSEEGKYRLATILVEENHTVFVNFLCTWRSEAPETAGEYFCLTCP